MNNCVKRCLSFFIAFVLLFDICSLAFYFVLSIRAIMRIMSLEEQNQKIQNLEGYNKTLSIMYDSIRGFRHDYSNFIQALNGYAMSNNMEGIAEMTESVMKEYQCMNKLAVLNPEVINHPGIYSIVTNKCYKAMEKNIAFNVDVQMDLRDKLIESGYKLTQIGSKNYCEFLGFHSFPMFMLDHNDYSERERIIGFNKYIRMLYMLENPDLIIIGVPGGVFPFDSYFDNNFGITNFFVSNAILPDYVIFNAIYVDDISEYLETVKSRVECRFNYEINQMFVSNYAFNYSVSLADKSLTYITCKTPDLLKRISGIDASNIYDSKQKECYVKKIIDTLHEYADVSVL